MKRAFVTLLYLGLATHTQASLRIVVGESSGTANEAFAVPIGLETDGSLVAIQFDLVSDLSKIVPDRITSETNLGRHRLDFETIEPGRERVVVYSASNAPLSSGALASLPVALSETVLPNQTSVTVESVVITDLDGDRIPVGVAPIIVSPRGSTLAEVGDSIPVTVILPSQDDVGVGALIANGVEVASFDEFPRTVPFSPTTPGRFSLNFEATMGGTITASDTIETRFVSPGYHSWARSFWTADEAMNPIIGWPGADPDFDGISNMLERAFGLDPTLAGTTGLPSEGFTTVGADTYLTITFQRPVDTDDFAYRVGKSTDLDSWDYSVGATLLVDSEISGNLEILTYRDSDPVGVNQRTQMRIRVDETHSE